MRRVGAVLAVVALLLCAVTVPVQAAEKEPLVIVFDTSSSMNDAAKSGTVKLSTAKDAMSALVRGTTDSSIGLGLWTYPGGAGDASGCFPGGWVPGLSPEDSPDATDIDAQIRLLDAAGDTPTGPALQAAVERLRAAGHESATIVLVSDGEANCGVPPCDVAREIVASGFNLTVAAVAFDIASEAMQADLQCIADATNGTYSTAEDSADLIDELEVFQITDLELSVQAPGRVLSGEVVTISATVTNPSRNPISNATLRLTFTEGDVAQFIPSPQRRLPVIQPGESVTRSWTIGSRSTVVGDRAWQVFAGTQTGSVRDGGTITFTDQPLSRADAGPLLKSHGGTVLVLGDSYSSGEGAGDYEPNSDQVTCHRSPHAYAGVVGGTGTKVIACSGAVAADLYGNVDFGSGGQLSKLTDAENPDVVFLTIGGNDIGFAGVVEQCFLRDCAPYRDSYLTRVGWTKGWTGLYIRISETVNTPERVAARGGRVVPVVVSPYPDPLWAATRGTCNISLNLLAAIPLTFAGAVPGEIGFFPDEIQTGKQILEALNAKVEASVDEARRQGHPIYFASTVRGFATAHSVCEPDSYFVRLTDSEAVRKGLNAASKQELFHPNREGHQAWANALITWSQGAKVDNSLTAPGAVARSLPEAALQNAGRPLIPSDTTIAVAGLRDMSSGEYPVSDVTYSVTPGGGVRFNLEELAPGSVITITVRSSPIVLASTRADDAGNATIDVTLPELSSERHELLVDAYDEAWALVGVAIPLKVTAGFTWGLAFLSGLVLASAIILLGALLRRRAARH